MKNRQTKLQPKRSHKRRGATAVEMAVTMPIVFLVFWGFWEWSRVEMIRHAAATAAYESSRRGILPGATIADMETVANEKLLPYSVSGAVVTPSIDAVNNLASVEISIPVDQNLWGTGRFFTGKHIVSRFDLLREK